MSSVESRPLVFYRFACLFESSLAIVAALFGWLTDINPFHDLRFEENAVWNGLLLTLPMLVVFFVLRQSPIAALQQIRQLLRTTLGVPLMSRKWPELLVLATIAGFSEELLFRGALQPWLEQFFTPLVALLVSNIVFALVHAVTPVYALMALLMGCYLSWSLDYSGERNLLQPIVLHAVYDFVAFMVIIAECRHLARSPNAD